MPTPVHGCASHPSCDAETPSDSIATEKELFITDLRVVEDPCRSRWDGRDCASDELGAWTFGKLMASLAGLSGIDEDPDVLSDFTLLWLRQIEDDQSINGLTVRGRPGVGQFVEAWARASGFRDSKDSDLVLDMTLAPLRLLAIVSRLDLRQASEEGRPGHAGEARFVFGFLGPGPGDDPDRWRTLDGTVIFEYSLPANSCENVSIWAERWHALGSLDFGADFNRALQENTDDFAGQNADPRRPNGSSISQMRTNEIAFAPLWELREFRLSDTPPPPVVLSGSLDRAQLVETTVAQTVDLRHNGSELLRRYVESERENLLADRHVVPQKFEGQPFLAGSALAPSGWNMPGLDCTGESHRFALNTCNSCHSDTTHTFFVHVSPRSTGRETRLSDFLTRGDVQDPTCRPSEEATQRFNDLERRALDLQDLLGSVCDKRSGDGEAIFLGKHKSKAAH